MKLVLNFTMFFNNDIPIFPLKRASFFKLKFYGDYGIGFTYHKIDHVSWALALISRSAIDHQPGFQVENDQFSSKAV